MEYPADFRFRPTDDVIIDYYLRLKHLGIEEGDGNHFITTVKISSFDPWDLPSKSKSKWNDNMVWYFYRRDEYKLNEEIWKTSSGYWKETGSNAPIIGKWKRSNGVKIGEKKVLVFHPYDNSNESTKLGNARVSPPRFCLPIRVEFKSEDIPSGSVAELNHSSTTPRISQNGASGT